MEHKKCSECKSYIQHYAYWDEKLHFVFYGHCSRKTEKKITPDSIACELFIPEESKGKQFVTKQYLTKALLQRVLSMELWED